MESPNEPNSDEAPPPAALSPEERDRRKAQAALDNAEFNRKGKLIKGCIEDLKLSLDDFNKMNNKEDLTNLMDRYDLIISWGVGGDISHTFIVARTDTGHLIKLDMVAVCQKDNPTSVTTHVIRGVEARNGYFFSDKTYIAVFSQIPIAESKAKGVAMKDCNIAWNMFITAALLDPCVFTIYNMTTNNCHQWCDSVCTRLHLPIGHSSLPEIAIRCSRWISKPNQEAITTATTAASTGAHTAEPVEGQAPVPSRPQQPEGAKNSKSSCSIL